MKKIILLSVLTLSLFGEEFKDLEFKGDGGSRIPFGDFSRENLLKVLGVQYPPLFKFWKDDPTFTKENGELFSEKLKEYYKSKGFYNVDINYSELNSTLIFNISKNSPLKIDSIKIQSDLNISNEIIVNKGDDFSPEEFTKMKSKINRKLQILGYIKAESDIKAYVDNVKNSVNIEIKVLKGERLKFGNSIIKGAENINRGMIENKLSFKENNFYNIEKIENSYQNLNDMDVFDYISIEPDYEKIVESKVPIIVELKSGKERAFKGSVGYSTNEGVRGKVSWSHKNLFGNLETTDINLKASELGYGLENRIFIPKFSLFAIENNLKYEKMFYDGYDEIKLSESFSLIKKLFGFNNYFGILIENSEIISDNNVEYGEGNYFISSLFYRATLDKRDSKIDAKNGYLVDFRVDFADSMWLSDIDFIKTLLELRGLKTVNDFTFASKLRVGTISEEVPSFKRFFTGGSLSNRGYEYRGVGEKDSSFNPIGGNSLMDFGVEIRHPIYKELSGAIFYDTSILNKEQYDFSGEMYNSIGFGFRYQTIVGPVRLDFGFPLNVPEETDNFQFHLTIGQAF